MNLFDIVGPIMVGPSSSHTAGAVKIGLVCNRLMDEKIIEAHIFLHGSFLMTGKGHGTDKAIVGGLIGMAVDDIRLPQSFELARQAGLDFSFDGVDLGDVHPNTAKLQLIGENGKQLTVVASSLGGGRIEVCELDGIMARFTGELPTLIVHNLDQPGHVTEVTSMLGHKGINIATIQLNRKSRGGEAVMVIECDQEVPKDSITWLEHLEGILKVTYLGIA